MSNMNKNYSHAYIIEGKEGEARDAYILDFAKSIICPNAIDGTACNNCKSCIRVSKGTHEDLFYMEQTGKETYRVDDAVALIEKLRMRPYGDFNVGIINNAERMSETVQNKLLKTLEEPSPGTVILLATSNRESLLPTVRSRCILKLLEDDNASFQNEEIDKLLAIWQKKAEFFKIRELTKKSFKSNENAFRFLDTLEIGERDKLIEGGCLPANTMKLLDNIDKIEATREAIKRGMNSEYALDSLYLRIK